MTDDILDRVERALDPAIGSLHNHPAQRLVRELADALRAARTENEQLRADAADLIERLENSSRVLDTLASTQQARSEIDRLQHKRQGVQLALSYAREYQR